MWLRQSLPRIANNMNIEQFSNTQPEQTDINTNALRNLGRVMLAPFRMASDILDQLSIGMGVETVRHDSSDLQKK